MTDQKKLGEEEESVEKEKSRRGERRFAESVGSTSRRDSDPQSSKGKATQLGDIL
ncbi:hypothetical protein Sjap_022684 [Stephania japonica]|uniref:Uncharacterized protein n=1 Tax=Stephania japonica TaxID=461633 RepID=A0AAP0EUQ8_9MAGN